MNMETSETLVNIQPTPNPNAWKYILNKPVLNDGKATYSSPEEAAHNNLAKSLFEIPGVRQVHYFQNVITLTYYFDVEAENQAEHKADQRAEHADGSTA